MLDSDESMCLPSGSQLVYKSYAKREAKLQLLMFCVFCCF